jgi:hypothetical protein
VISKGAKFVGTSIGGVEVVIRDAETGQILARGKTAGTTGDTAKLMTEKAPHHAPVSTEDAAVFRARVDLAEPRRIEVTARGPLSQRQAENTASVTQWMVPGKPVTGGRWTGARTARLLRQRARSTRSHETSPEILSRLHCGPMYA